MTQVVNIDGRHHSRAVDKTEMPSFEMGWLNSLELRGQRLREDTLILPIRGAFSRTTCCDVVLTVAHHLQECIGILTRDHLSSIHSVMLRT